MTLKDVMSMSWDEINKLNIRDLRSATRTLADVANKRINRLEKSDYVAKNALNAAREGGGKFSTKGLNTNQLRGELNRARAFLSLKTSTVRGASKVYKAREKALYGAPAESREQALSRLQQSNKVEELYGKFLQLNPTSKNTLGSETLRGLAAEMVEDNPDMTIDDLLNDMSDRYIEMYEEENGNDYEWEEF